MAFYYVCGRDQIYGGYHGLSYDTVIEGSEKDALDVGIELSENLIDSYSCITDNLEDQVAELCENKNINYWDSFTWTDEEADIVEDIRADVYSEDRDYFFVKLDKTKLPTLDAYELDAILCEMGSEEFLDKYKLED